MAAFNKTSMSLNACQNHIMAISEPFGLLCEDSRLDQFHLWSERGLTITIYRQDLYVFPMKRAIGFGI